MTLRRKNQNWLRVCLDSTMLTLHVDGKERRGEGGRGREEEEKKIRRGEGGRKGKEEAEKLGKSIVDWRDKP